MIGAAYGTVSDIEIFWTMIALIGIILSLFNLRDAVADIRLLERMRVDNGRMIVARISALTEALRATVQGLFMMIGIISAFIPESPPHAELKYKVLGGLVVWGLILSSVLLSFKSLLVYRMRRELIADYARRDAEDAIRAAGVESAHDRLK